MTANIKLGKISGIPIGLNNSWFLIFGLVTWSLATAYFPSQSPDLSTLSQWILGLITSILFFGSVLAHELGHAYLSRRNNIPVRAINLFIFGGVAQIEKEPQTAGQEFRIAIAGPIVSFLLAFFFGALALLGNNVAWVTAVTLWLARINLILAIFNLIPGFPLDGGRVLRAILWRFNNNHQQSTQIAASVGKFVAFGFMGLGILIIFIGSLFDGLWLLFIGWFLQNAAAATAAEVNLKNTLRGLFVEDVMNKKWPTIPSKLPLSRLVEEELLRGGPRYYIVARDGYQEDPEDDRPYGMVSVTDVMTIPETQWPFTPVDKVMTPWQKLVSIVPQTPINEAIRIMDEAKVTQLPVLHKEQLVGILSREQIINYLRLRTLAPASNS